VSAEPITGPNVVPSAKAMLMMATPRSLSRGVVRSTT
jgi:hypothetical protein